MDKKSSVGVCFCTETNGHPDSFDSTALVAFAKSLSRGKEAWNQFCLQITSPNAFVLNIQNAQLDRIGIVGKNPAFLKYSFPRVSVMFVRIFPLPDIAAYMLTSKMVQVDQRPNIEHLTSNC